MKKGLLFLFLLVALVFAASVTTVFAMPLHIMRLTVSPQALTDILLGTAGVILQLAVMYVPGFSTWYQNLTNKGLAMLALVIVVAGVYFGLACTPLAVMLNIQLACTVPDLFVLLQAIFFIAISQNVAYAYLKPTVKRRFGN